MIIFATLVLSVLAGCNGAAAGKAQPMSADKNLLTVDFQQGQTMQYRFVSSRAIAVDFDPKKKISKSTKSRVKKFSESMTMVVAYTPVEVDPYGLTTIEATCKSVKVKRSSGLRAGRDAVMSLKGKTFTFTVSPSGGIADYSQLDELIREIGKKAFRANTKKDRIKEPDMIGDFVATQWFLWDSISSIEKPYDGVSVGRTWGSKLSVPTPMVTRKARDVTYTLDEIRDSEEGRLAVIRSSFSPAESAPRSWPIPYSGRFQMSGTFGLLYGYKVLGLEGDGEELFNIDAGRTEKCDQQYKMQMEASMMMGLARNLQITINQKLTMKLLDDEKKARR